MEIKHYFSIIMKRLWIIIVLPVIAVSITGYVNFYVFAPIYQAQTTLLITGLQYTVNSGMNTMNYEDILAGKSLVDEYSEIIKSWRVTSAVLQDLNLSSIKEENLKDMIKISSINGTRILNLSVQNKDPALAVRIADSCAKTFTAEISKLYKIDNINIIDMAKLPKEPIGPNKTKNMFMALMASLVSATGIVFLIEYLDNTIKTTEDVEKYLSLNVIGTIPLQKLEIRGEKL